MQKAASQLCDIFQDVNFAWELLNAQMQIEMANIAPGDTIAYLLQLYMRGVQKMNSLGDSRQSYFKNKVTTLMTKQTVIKSLKQNPMKKKTKPDQVTEIKTKEQKKNKQKTPEKKIKKKQQINQLQLKQKRRQLQMRMAYVAEQHGPDSLRKIIAQQDHRQQNISNKISKIINSHQQRLNQRIRARKLKTATFRSRSQVNMQQSQMIQVNQYEKQQNKMQQKQFSPFKKLILKQLAKKEQKKEQGKDNKIQLNHRRFKSLQVLRDMSQSPSKKLRKYTHDQINVNPKKSFS